MHGPAELTMLRLPRALLLLQLLWGHLLLLLLLLRRRLSPTVKALHALQIRLGLLLYAWARRALHVLLRWHVSAQWALRIDQGQCSIIDSDLDEDLCHRSLAPSAVTRTWELLGPCVQPLHAKGYELASRWRLLGTVADLLHAHGGFLALRLELPVWRTHCAASDAYGRCVRCLVVPACTSAGLSACMAQRWQEWC